MELESLRKLTPLAIAAFGQEETYHPTVELFTDVLNRYVVQVCSTALCASTRNQGHLELEAQNFLKELLILLTGRYSFPFFLTAENLESLAILLTSSRAQEMISQLQNGA